MDVDLLDTLALHPLQHLKELNLADCSWEKPEVDWPMHWSTLTSVTALTCLVQSKLPELVVAMTQLCSLEIEYSHTQNQSQQDRLRLQSLNRLTSLKITELGCL